MLMFAQIRATTVAPASTEALPVSVRRNDRSGVSRRRAHAVRPENAPEPDESATSDEAASDEAASAEAAASSEAGPSGSLIDGRRRRYAAGNGGCAHPTAR